MIVVGEGTERLRGNPQSYRNRSYQQLHTDSLIIAGHAKFTINFQTCKSFFFLKIHEFLKNLKNQIDRKRTSYRHEVLHNFLSQTLRRLNITLIDPRLNHLQYFQHNHKVE
jgi:hypothetical protein